MQDRAMRPENENSTTKTKQKSERRRKEWSNEKGTCRPVHLYRIPSRAGKQTIWQHAHSRTICNFPIPSQASASSPILAGILPPPSPAPPLIRHPVPTPIPIPLPLPLCISPSTLRINPKLHKYYAILHNRPQAPQ